MYGWVTLPTLYLNGGTDCGDWCGTAAQMAGLNKTEYDHIVCYPLYCDPGDPTCQVCKCGTCWYAWGSPGGICRTHEENVEYTGFAATTTPSDISEGIKSYMAHELGHNIGLPHANTLGCSPADDKSAAKCQNQEYGDPFTFMGGSSAMSIPTYWRLTYGWMPTSYLTNVSVPAAGSSSDVTLTKANIRMSRGDGWPAAGSTLAARVGPLAVGGVPANDTWFVEHGWNWDTYQLEMWSLYDDDYRPWGLPTGAERGVLVYITPDTIGVCWEPPNLMYKPDAASVDPRSTWLLYTVGQTYTDPVRKVKFTLTAIDAATATVKIEPITAVSSPPPPPSSNGNGNKPSSKGKRMRMLLAEQATSWS